MKKSLYESSNKLGGWSFKISWETQALRNKSKSKVIKERINKWRSNKWRNHFMNLLGGLSFIWEICENWKIVIEFMFCYTRLIIDVIRLFLNCQAIKISK